METCLILSGTCKFFEVTTLWVGASPIREFLMILTSRRLVFGAPCALVKNLHFLFVDLVF